MDSSVTAQLSRQRESGKLPSFCNEIAFPFVQIMVSEASLPVLRVVPCLSTLPIFTRVSCCLKIAVTSPFTA